MTASRSEVYAAIDGERQYQDSRWNEQTTTTKGLHTFEEWIVYMEDYLAEAKHILSRESAQNAQDRVGHIMRQGYHPWCGCHGTTWSTSTRRVLMPLDKAIKSGKEHRKPYRRSGKFDRSCRPGGSCPYCRGNRTVQSRRMQQRIKDQEN